MSLAWSTSLFAVRTTTQFVKDHAGVSSGKLFVLSPGSKDTDNNYANAFSGVLSNGMLRLDGMKMNASNLTPGKSASISSDVGLGTYQAQGTELIGSNMTYSLGVDGGSCAVTFWVDNFNCDASNGHSCDIDMAVSSISSSDCLSTLETGGGFGTYYDSSQAKPIWGLASSSDYMCISQHDALSTQGTGTWDTGSTGTQNNTWIIFQGGSTCGTVTTGPGSYQRAATRAQAKILANY